VAVRQALEKNLLTKWRACLSERGSYHRRRTAVSARRSPPNGSAFGPASPSRSASRRRSGYGPARCRAGLRTFFTTWRRQGDGDSVFDCAGDHGRVTRARVVRGAGTGLAPTSISTFPVERASTELECAAPARSESASVRRRRKPRCFESSPRCSRRGDISWSPLKLRWKRSPLAGRTRVSSTLVITDYTMPELTGAEFADDVARLRPRAPVLVGAGSAILRHHAPPNIRASLQKPVPRSSLCSARWSAPDSKSPPA